MRTRDGSFNAVSAIAQLIARNYMPCQVVWSIAKRSPESDSVSRSRNVEARVLDDADCERAWVNRDPA